ncbi:adenylate/guanylate cyclase domain-containing protein [Methylorubrum sp. SL192]|uniref:adenylate/guanylate cyclase domain-containing protein n=1 Tax=Methylorubrum sp. SL192 TaxID=2995167 RepID=UPI001477F113|nr:adenylate/guanylate cyclase domain-containing protein [Methylorubrum sp. SL192]MCY1640821.1 adenylate/guanylate cyclase domain-containing protein [Methylorubrum sp. SL192]
MKSWAAVAVARRALPLFLAVAIFGACAGWVFAGAFETGRPFINTIYGMFFSLTLFLYERGKLLPGLRARVRRAATPIFFAATLLIFGCTFVVGTTVAGTVLWAVGIASTPILDVAPTAQKLTYAFVTAALLVAVLRMRDLIGPRMFMSFLLGRYHKPRREERVFLFLDLIGSTRFAEERGDLEAMLYLGHVFEVLARPVELYRGSIDDYVGDMALVTWRMGPDLEDAAPIRCLFTFLDQVERDAGEWRRRFGEVPRFRAALHCGPVMTGEIGVDRHKITYFGDVINTTSRLESLAKALDEPVVVSAELLARLGPVPEGVTVTNLGRHSLRGRGEALEVVGLRRSIGED